MKVVGWLVVFPGWSLTKHHCRVLQYLAPDKTQFLDVPKSRNVASQEAQVFCQTGFQGYLATHPPAVDQSSSCFSSSTTLAGSLLKLQPLLCCSVLSVCLFTVCFSIRCNEKAQMYLLTDPILHHPCPLLDNMTHSENPAVITNPEPIQITFANEIPKLGKNYLSVCWWSWVCFWPF